ncbi:hypothetical protein FRX31_002823 [Thalictrum thalictroides]|uniref:Uncharacterized protein n=1 Tax=Thalictrum thalictroides TaxID=46969 RepID=A0A7J6XGG1_THATH|nr:hypothetical protein FRX31_002823 [Thalictrum thalictroides]
MENLSSVNEADAVGLNSCWGRFKVMFPWRNCRQRSYHDFSLLKSFSTKQRKPKGGFKYDALSYAQNFDEGSKDEDNEDSIRGFSSRFAAPVPKPVVRDQ